MPSTVEKAYYRKCIDLRRRITEVEEHNDATRLRIKRLNRSVLKMRLERAFLLEQLQQRMEYNVDGSDRSTSPPPTVGAAPVHPRRSAPQDKPLRSKRSHRKTSPTAPSSPQGGQSPPPPSSHAAPTHVNIQPHTSVQAMSSAQSTPDPGRSGMFFAGSPPTTSVNGASAPGGGSRLPPPQPSFYEQSSAGGAYDERRSVSAVRENGGAEYGRAYATSERTGPGSEISNGDRRLAADVEMQDSSRSSAPREGGAFSGGFTAVNR